MVRTANRTAFAGETLVPADMVATSAITKAITGAKYHCGVTAVDRLKKASAVTSSA